MLFQVRATCRSMMSRCAIYNAKMSDSVESEIY
jgi:hypothetical protein